MLNTYEGTVRHGQIRLPVDVTLPEGARVHVTVLPGVDERTAKRKANRWLAEHVGDMVMADHGQLGQRVARSVWRFSAFVTSLSKEPFGPIGYLEVDADSGIVLADDLLAEEMARRGERLERAPLPSTE